MTALRTLAMISTSEMKAPRPEGRIVRIQMRHEEIDSGIATIHLKGRLDVLGVQKIELQFTELSTYLRKPIIVDLSEVELMSSVGLGMLITAAATLKAEGRSFVLFKPQPRVERVIRIAGLDEFLPIEFDLKRAIKRIKSKGSILSHRF
jgi:anti-sigma B factor antagonist